MKKLTLAVAVLSLSIAAPVFACPQESSAPSTAETPKASEAKTAKADHAKAKKTDRSVKPDKVSQR
jgi:hypothetical protein